MKMDEAGLQAVLVGMGDPGQAEAFRRELELPFPLVCDTEKALYKAYGLRRATIAQTASPKILVKGMAAMLAGHKLGIPARDPLQMGGAFLIDTSGTIRWSYLAKDVSDYPSVDVLVEAWRSVQEPLPAR